jgi:hypothetical protein
VTVSAAERVSRVRLEYAPATELEAVVGARTREFGRPRDRRIADFSDGSAADETAWADDHTVWVVSRSNSPRGCRCVAVSLYDRPVPVRN